MLSSFNPNGICPVPGRDISVPLATRSHLNQINKDKDEDR